MEPLGVSASSRERFVEAAGEAGRGAVSLAFVRLRPSLFQAGTRCSVMVAVAKGQSHARPKKRRNKNYAEVHLRPGKARECQGSALFRWKLHDERANARTHTELHYHHNPIAIHHLADSVLLACFGWSFHTVLILIHDPVAHHESVLP